jgi:hypothetical protein
MNGDLRGIEDLARQRNHTIHQLTFTAEQLGSHLFEGVGDGGVN